MSDDFGIKKGVKNKKGVKKGVKHYRADDSSKS